MNNGFTHPKTDAQHPNVMLSIDDVLAEREAAFKRAFASIGGIDYNSAKQPAPLFGEGFSDEARKQTTLSKYLKLETWPPLWAAMLVCGIQPSEDCTEMPQYGMTLGNLSLMPSSRPFKDAKKVLSHWNREKNSPSEVRPADFVAWCKTKGINTDWLRDVPSDVAVTQQVDTQLQAVTAEAVPVVEVPAEVPPAKRLTLWSVVTPYIVEIMRAGQYATAKQLFKTLEAKAGEGSPFDKGNAINRGSLFVREISQSMAMKTLQNNWTKLKDAAKK